MKYLKFFSEIEKDDLTLVGGKGLSLGVMTKSGISVPNGFVVLASAGSYFQDNIIPQDFWPEIETAFNQLNCQNVAVRSSAVAEDSTQNSWAGQMDTFLNIGKSNLQEAVINCFNSINSERAKAYALSNNITNKKIAVVIQKMVNAQKAGVLFTVNPVNKDQNEVMVEGVYGLGELLVSGMVTPYNYILDRNTLGIKSKSKSDQREMLVNSQDGVKKIALSKNENEELLSGELLNRLIKLSLEVEKIYGIPQDIEWGIENNNIFILQSRPITTL